MQEVSQTHEFTRRIVLRSVVGSGFTGMISLVMHVQRSTTLGLSNMPKSGRRKPRWSTTASTSLPNTPMCELSNEKIKFPQESEFPPVLPLSVR